jgi:shikimate dehydrogenase
MTPDNGSTMTKSSMTKSCFVIGHPISHSRSPLIHQHWIAKLGLDGDYQRIDVPPIQLAGFVARLREGELTGGNVTLPHKQVIVPLLDALTPSARAAGAVNTVFNDGGRITGDNTDITGFLNHLDATAPGWTARVGKAVIMGAGGAAQAICHGLMMRGVPNLTIVNRDLSRAQSLAAALKASVLEKAPQAIDALAWEGRNGAMAGCDLVVNATSLGMKGQPKLDIDLSAMPAHGIAYDIVYVPLETELLAQSRARGLVAVDGLGMLLHQAAPAFARWFGILPDVTPDLRAIIEADIA